MIRTLFILFLLLSIGCQDEITLELAKANEKIVVEGSIEQGFPPYVILTKNQGYFDPINQNTYANLFVKDAKVKVWSYNEDGTIDSTILTSLPPPYDSIPIYTDANLLNPAMVGEVGRTYYLEIIWNNQIITSSTTIPEPTPLDCLWVEKNETAEKDYKYDIRAIYSDPANIQKNILIRSKRLEYWRRDSTEVNGIREENDPQLILVDAGPDVLINGETFETYFPKPKEEGGFPTGSYNTKRWKTFDNNGTLDSVELPHDIVLLKFCQIDQPSLLFWRGVVRQVTTGGNPFSEPMNLTSNIVCGLGGWTGYGAVYYEIPILEGTTVLNAEEDLDLWNIF